VSRPQRVEVVLVEADEGPERLEDYLLVSHVSNRVNETNSVEGKLDVVTLSCHYVQVVTNERVSVGVVRGLTSPHQGIGCLDVVVNQVSR